MTSEWAAVATPNCFGGGIYHQALGRHPVTASSSSGRREMYPSITVAVMRRTFQIRATNIMPVAMNQPTKNKAHWTQFFLRSWKFCRFSGNSPFLWKPKVHKRVLKYSYWRLSSQINPINMSPSSYFEIHFNITKPIIPNLPHTTGPLQQLEITVFLDSHLKYIWKILF